jgi:6-pyruvoyltetrahydropterin/6-carboxytetrahydropterin synthase
MQVSVSRKSDFNAAHRLHVKEWSDEKNKEIFGVCNNKHYHGHNYSLIVTVTGEMDSQTGYVMDTKILKDIIRTEVEDRFDHKNLNMDTVEFKELNPTAENIAVVIWKLIRTRIDNHLQLKIKLYETERNFVEYEGK